MGGQGSEGGVVTSADRAGRKRGTTREGVGHGKHQCAITGLGQCAVTDDTAEGDVGIDRQGAGRATEADRTAEGESARVRCVRAERDVTSEGDVVGEGATRRAVARDRTTVELQGAGAESRVAAASERAGFECGVSGKTVSCREREAARTGLDDASRAGDRIGYGQRVAAIESDG